MMDSPKNDRPSFYIRTNGPIVRTGRSLHLMPVEASAIAPFAYNSGPSVTAKKNDELTRNIIFADMLNAERSLLGCCSPEVQPFAMDNGGEDVVRSEIESPLPLYQSYQPKLHTQVDKTGRVSESNKPWAKKQLDKATLAAADWIWEDCVLQD